MARLWRSIKHKAWDWFYQDLRHGWKDFPPWENDVIIRCRGSWKALIPLLLIHLVVWERIEKHISAVHDLWHSLIFPVWFRWCGGLLHWFSHIHLWSSTELMMMMMMGVGRGDLSDGCGCMLLLHHYLHREACSISVIPANCSLPLLAQHPFTATTLNPPAWKTNAMDRSFHRYVSAADKAATLQQQRRRRHWSITHAYNPTHSYRFKETPFAAFFRCSQALQTFPLSWVPRQDQHSAADRHTTNATPLPKTDNKEATLAITLWSRCCFVTNLSRKGRKRELYLTVEVLEEKPPLTVRWDAPD